MNANRVIVGAGLVIALLASGVGLYQLGLHHAPKATDVTPSDAVAPRSATTSVGTVVSSSDATAGKKVLYWHDPMVPAQKFDKPGKSPFMDMQLVPVYADSDSGIAGQVTISPQVQQNLGVRIAEVKQGALTSTMEATGSVAYDERDVAVVQARSNGFLERLYVRAPLDPVRKGQVLAEIYVPDWVAAQEEYLSAKRIDSRIDARSDTTTPSGLADAARQRMRLAGMSDDQIKTFETAGKVQIRAVVTAPIGGVIGELTAREGMTITAGAPLFRINGLSTVWVNADIPEAAAAQVHRGNAVEVRTPALPAVIFRGKVSAILPEVNAATRTIKARVEVANPSGQLAPGMFTTIAFASGSREEVLLVPTEAVIQTGVRSVVIVARDDGTFAPVDVEAGLERNGQTEIRKGVRHGQKVVASGQFLVDSESSLKATTARMGEASAPTSGDVIDRPGQGEIMVPRSSGTVTPLTPTVKP